MCGSPPSGEPRGVVRRGRGRGEPVPARTTFPPPSGLPRLTQPVPSPRGAAAHLGHGTGPRSTDSSAPGARSRLPPPAPDHAAAGRPPSPPPPRGRSCPGVGGRPPDLPPPQAPHSARPQEPAPLMTRKPRDPSSPPSPVRTPRVFPTPLPRPAVQIRRGPDGPGAAGRRPASPGGRASQKLPPPTHLGASPAGRRRRLRGAEEEAPLAARPGKGLRPVRIGFRAQ
uniref:proline-rich protein HaeIII subfamily 1-like n=1 Tax=Euleptes europaea TaxID=460621 RepID=UPI002541AA2F|nr:proline-rich protein HaeIII subfamily 1-like [Euleptes europaea]